MIYSGSGSKFFIFGFWIRDPDPDPTRIFKLIKITKKNLAKLIYLFKYFFKDDKIVPEKIKNLIKIFRNKRC